VSGGLEEKKSSPGQGSEKSSAELIPFLSWQFLLFPAIEDKPETLRRAKKRLLRL